MKSAALFLTFFLAGACLYGLDSNGTLTPPPPIRGGQAATSETDANGDGAVDYIVYFDKSGTKLREEFDFNSDGKMDDFMFYENGVPLREEIDSNYDGKVDVWVYLIQGKYIKRYEKDTDGDGVPDVTKDYE